MNTSDKNGRAGGSYLTSAQGAQTGKKFFLIEVLEDGTEFSVLTNGVMDGADLTSRTWKRGDRIWGLTTAITVSAGEVLAWKDQ
jgi:hypothetical protein